MNGIGNKLFGRFDFAKRNDIVGKSVNNLVLQVIGMGLSYLAVFLISHVYNADVLGYYTLSNVVLQISAMVVLFGINTATVQMVPGLYAAKDNNSVSSLILKGIFHTLFFGILVSVILYFSANFVATHFLHKPKLGLAFQEVSFAVMPLALLTLCADFLRGCGKNVLWAIIISILSSLIFIVVFSGLYFLHKGPEPVIVNSFAYIIALGITLTIFGLFIRKNAITLKLTNLSQNPSYAALRKISFPMFLFSSNILIGGWISTIMVGIYGTTADTGIYRVIDRISSLCTIVLIGVNAVLAPKIAAAYAKKDFILLKHDVLFATRLNFWLSLPLQLGLIIFHKFILRIFGAEFLQGSTALLIVLFGYIFNSLTGPVGQVLNMTNYQVFLRNFSFLALLLTIVLNYFLIPRFGIAGAAFASMFNSIFINIICVFKIRKEFSFNMIFNPFKVLAK
jgi:O-antigen/teichoic acid export membrane protein